MAETRTVTVADLDIGEIELDEDELVDGALIIIRTQMSENQTRLIVRGTDGTDWVTKRGMVDVAQQYLAESTSTLVSIIEDGEDPDE